MKIKRREFLAKSLAGVGGIILGDRFVRADEKKPKYFDPYECVQLGKTGLVTSCLGLGTGMRGGNRESNQTRLGKKKFEYLIRAGYERGIRLFDTADLYGSHPYIIPALKGIPRDKYLIVSKIWLRRGGIPEEKRPDAGVVVKRFLKELNTDYIDILHLHCMTSPNWPQEHRKQMDILHDIKNKGFIRAHGVSCHRLAALNAAAAEPWVDVVHARINAYGTKMDGMPDVVAPVLKKFHLAGKGVIGMKLIAEGTFRNDPEKRQQSVKFVLQLGVVDAMVVGFENIEEIDDFAASIRKVSRTG